MESNLAFLTMKSSRISSYIVLGFSWQVAAETLSTGEGSSTKSIVKKLEGQGVKASSSFIISRIIIDLP